MTPEETRQSMFLPTRRTNRVRTVIFVVAGLAALTGCTPEQIALFNHVTGPYQDAVTDEQLATLRLCESTDNYAAVSASGRYRGAYQFSQTTWDRVARAHFPWLAGTDRTVVARRHGSRAVVRERCVVLAALRPQGLTPQR
jgi:hypothetical protein